MAAVNWRLHAKPDVGSGPWTHWTLVPGNFRFFWICPFSSRDPGFPRWDCESIAKPAGSAYQFCVSEELIKIHGDMQLCLKRSVENGVLQLVFSLESDAPWVLHWGVARGEGGRWELPMKTSWPADSTVHGRYALQSPFLRNEEGSHVVLRFPGTDIPAFVVFDLYSPETGHWQNNRGKDYWVRLTEPGPSATIALEEHFQATGNSHAVEMKLWSMDGGGELAAGIKRSEDSVILTLVTDIPGPIFLHWGIQERARWKWKQPRPELWPVRTVQFDETAVRSPFMERDGLNWIRLELPRKDEVQGLGFVLYEFGTDRWIKHRGADVFLRLEEAHRDNSQWSGLMERIVDGEMGPHGWTLMHRFNLCQELIEDADGDREAWATLFVWLRYSAIRQLDWQRNYNTKPRELSHAQDRLTGKLAESFVRFPAQRELIRLMIGCVGRGGDGQRIRDEILHIMHRHHIKEVGGTWMEQWHQKLHNNTTPDDIVICEAYLAFLRSNGDLGAYDYKLGEGGVTRERLAGFERPITRSPEWHPHLKDGLIHDFEHYLQLLRSVHSGTDLETAGNSGSYLLDDGARDALGFVRWNFGNPGVGVLDMATRITEVRRKLAGTLAHETNPGRVKDGLYLDLALEEALRTVIERQLHSGLNGETLLDLISQVLTNLLLVGSDAELEQCTRELACLPAAARFNQDWSLRAKAVMDRLSRAVENLTDTTYRLLQPKAEQLGHAFEADEWTVKLFSEEIVRGRPVFVLSMLLHQMDPILRRNARLGDWQVISPSRAAGEVVVVDELRSIQGARFNRPTIVISEKVQGDEEPPEGVQAVLTSRSVDLVSHVAVRARNASLLFATCHDPQAFAQLRQLEGRSVIVSVTSAGDLTFKEGVGDQSNRRKTPSRKPPRLKSTETSLRVLQQLEFESGLVGGKSLRIREMSERLAGEFRTPRSIALPFGVFDAVLASVGNSEHAERLQSLLKQAQTNSGADLSKLRSCILDLQLPETLMQPLRTALEYAGLPVPRSMDAAASKIKQVWASLWNDRAYLSREANGLPHDQVSMAVLIQEVIEADYAFVIHTVNPTTGNQDEVYGEVVQGLGETLVGNYPGRAMSFTARKSNLQPTITAYPSKSVALRGGGLIFRSDSNAEDLEGYAGAGLYDSVLLEPAREERVDYTRDPLLGDAAFQERTLRGITALSCSVEKSFGGAQDIEGVWAHNELYVVQTRPQVGSR